MKQNIYAKLFISTVVLLLVSSCNDRGKDKVYCQGQVIRDIVQDKNHDEISRKFKLLCSGDCPNKNPCKIDTVTYDPPQANGLIMKEFCGCKGDTTPRWCDVILYTYNINGRIIQQADCTPYKTCPIDTDSCIQQNRETVDTIRSVDHHDSLYHYHAVISCDCMNRKVQKDSIK
jgi:hypothetical protein